MFQLGIVFNSVCCFLIVGVGVVVFFNRETEIIKKTGIINNYKIYCPGESAKNKAFIKKYHATYCIILFMCLFLQDCTTFLSCLLGHFCANFSVSPSSFSHPLLSGEGWTRNICLYYIHQKSCIKAVMY